MKFKEKDFLSALCGALMTTVIMVCIFAKIALPDILQVDAERLDLIHPTKSMAPRSASVPVCSTTTAVCSIPTEEANTGIGRAAFASFISKNEFKELKHQKNIKTKSVRFTRRKVTVSVEQELTSALRRHRITSLNPGPKYRRGIVKLGKALFFDKILSGNKDISCATCHHPEHHASDDISLSIGTMGGHLGSHRELGEDSEFIPRNTPAIFNRGSSEWSTLDWDGRISLTPDRRVVSPAGKDLPAGIKSLLAAQAMFPVASREKMRGRKGDKDIHGRINELALIEDDDYPAIWKAVMKRLLAIPEYVKLFQFAYPYTPKSKLGFQHAANAIAAFETNSLTFLKSQWDSYLAGEDVLSDKTKKGALLFYGKAKCVSCHSGNLLSDQDYHNIGVPQIGPGMGKNAPLDLGREIQTGNPDDRFAFRTPSLRNVELTGPWMHNGSIVSLVAAIRHHINPEKSLLRYTGENLRPDISKRLVGNSDVQAELLRNLSPILRDMSLLSAIEIDQIISFLQSLTDLRTQVAPLSKLIPETVPSGIKVDRH